MNISVRHTYEDCLRYNCLLVSIPTKSKYRHLFDAFLQDKFSLVINNDILLEYEEIIQERANKIVAESIVKQLLKSTNIIFQQVYFKWNLISADPDDNKFVDVAVASNANYIVTEDKHFNELGTVEFPSITVISIAQFSELLATFQELQ